MSSAEIPVATGPEASRLRRRLRLLPARFQLPGDALPGSLALSHRRCGKASCHCADATGHPLWTLTFMASGKKRVENIPAGWRVKAGRRFKDTSAELPLINAELLTLAQKQRRRPSSRPAPPPP